ncbi:MAG: IPT/TIG domain-containing protein, partial [Actinobacteria bacterium]|nr:IPT/TIG domain-containing protein [Actinomycetota bacterium]
MNLNSRANFRYITFLFLIIFLILFSVFNSFADIGPPPLEPTITNVTPGNGVNTSTTNITITGTNFHSLATAKIGSIDLTNVVWVSDTTINATVPTGLAPGTYDISVINPGDMVGTLTNGFRVKQKPTAFIDSVSPNPAEVGNLITFTGHGEDADGNIIAHNWRSSIDEFLSANSSFNTTTLSPGIHTIYFRVKDNDGEWSDEVSMELIIGWPNSPPIANAGPNQTVNEGTAVNLNGAGSSDPDGDTLSYNWTQTAGPAVTLNNPNTA